MSYQIKRLSLTLMMAGTADGNFPSTMYARSSTRVPAAPPAPAGSVAVRRARRAGAPGRHDLNRLPGRVEMHCGTSWGVASVRATASKMRSGWAVLDADKRKPLDDRKAARPRTTRAILIGGLLARSKSGGVRETSQVVVGPFQAASPSVGKVSLDPSFGPTMKLACWGAKKSRSPWPILLGSVRFDHARARTAEKIVGSRNARWSTARVSHGLCDLSLRSPWIPS